MPDIHDQLLAAIKGRGRKQEMFGRGILTADCYVKTLQDELGLDRCYRYMARDNVSFNDVVEKAARVLTYSNDDMVVEEKNRQKLGLPSEVELPKNTLMVFRHVLTSSRKDRDGDMLHSDGAEVDPKMLLLWQHVHTMPIGKMIHEVEKSPNRLVLVSAIVDINELCHDAAVMVDNGMGRFSHGFRAVEYTENKARDGEQAGFEVKRFEILEESLASVPANVDAETEEVLLSLVDRGKLTSGIVKEQAKVLKERRATTVPVKLDLKLSVNGREVEHEDPSRGGAGEEKRTAGSPEEADAKAQAETKNAGDAEVKMVGWGDVPGSYEEVAAKLRPQIRQFLLGAGVKLGEHDYEYIVATFADNVVVGVEGSGPAEYYRIGWSKEGGEITLAGEPKKVEIQISAEVREVMKQLADLQLKQQINREKSEPVQGEKPYPNEHACRLRPPGDFQADSFRRTKRKHEGKEYSVIMGRLEGESAMTEQAYRYPKDEWDVGAAKSHCSDHDGATFEPAGKAAVLEGEKLGRVLSKANEGKIKEARDDVNEAAKMDGVPRSAKALLNQASRGLGEVLSSLGPAEGEKEADKEAGFELKMLCGMALLLSRGSDKQLCDMKGNIEAVQRARKNAARVEKYRKVRK